MLKDSLLLYKEIKIKPY